MIIPVTDNRRIYGGERDWAVQRPMKRKDGIEWQSFRYYSSFAGAMESCVHEEIRLHPAHTLTEAIEAVHKLIHKYEALIPSRYRLVKDDV